MVCVAVWILRKREPNLQRNFKVPALPVIATCGILINTYLIINLSWEAQTLSFSWLIIGMIVYFYTVKEILNFKMEALEKPSRQNKNRYKKLILI
jgi:APA family basic amino acid/polyamine antiporter